MKEKIVVLIAVILFLSISFAGCLSQYTKNERRPIAYLSLSSDGTRLLSVTFTDSISLKNHTQQQGADLQILDTISGENIWSEFPVYEYDYRSISTSKAIISPYGNYYVKDEPISPTEIYNASSGILVTNLSGSFVGWFPNERIITLEPTYTYVQSPQEIIIWNGKNFNEIIAFSLEWIASSEHLTLSPDGKKLVFFSMNTNQLSALDISNENTSYLWNTSLSEENNNINHLKWSADGKTIGFYHYNESKGTSRLMILNASDGNVLYDIPIEYKYVYMYSNSLIASDCKKYIIHDYENNSLLFFNLTNLEKSIGLEPGNAGLYVAFDWSYDGNVISVGYGDGKIEIRNASTWELINTLESTTHEYYYEIPGFELILVLIAVALVLFWKRRRI
jgi:WD40 repeat protein